jgi:ArsR family transcriptional regulator, lead/cadmium/zinc/bismuth-responsive transcriptional repressor
MSQPPRTTRLPADAGKPALGSRPLLSALDAEELVRLFKMLASDTRLRLLHALERTGELCVTDLAAELAMSPQAVSNQLQRLVDRRIVASRREGSRHLYQIADPCVTGLLDLGLCLLEETGRALGRAGADPAMATDQGG